MTPQIIVWNEKGEKVGETFPKRAKQLINKRKARWRDATQSEIELISPDLKEDFIMESYPNRADDNILAEKSLTPLSPKTMESDDALIGLAKERIAEKRVLVGRFLDLAVVAVFSFFLMISSYSYTRFVLAMLLCLYFLVRFLVRAIKFAKPSFQKGIAFYLQTRRENELISEYNKVKRMSAK